MRALAAKTLLLLFVALVVQCAFDGPVAQTFTASPSQEDSAFCAVLGATSLETALPIQCAPQPSSGDTISPLSLVFPPWSLAHSIDHPPELRA